MNITLPTIHLNGTGRDTLRRDYMKAYEALHAFCDAFRAIEFNARDYYVQSNTAFSEARADREREHRRIAEVMAYLEAHLAHLS